MADQIDNTPTLDIELGPIEQLVDDAVGKGFEAGLSGAKQVDFGDLLDRAAAMQSPTNQAGEVEDEFAGMTAGEAIEATRGNDTLMRDLSFAYVAAKNMPGIASVIDRARHALATQPATSQEGEDEDVIHDCGNLGWCQAPGYCSRHGTAATPTPPTLSEDLRALVEIEKFGHGDGHGRGYTCADMAAAALARAQVPQ